MTQQAQFIDDRMAALFETDEDLRRMVAGDWMRYRASPALQELTREANAVCAKPGRRKLSAMLGRALLTSCEAEAFRAPSARE